ncbi:MAG TPA: glycosyltransferase family 2 protein [Noviherbaspirillum sp.]|jgi:putative glycosyltransferase|uniref:glycosyltransferase family 2 protein n=1 Tax=Noviherbaspirillum sp. TaxID=1926288 RepID=UPI002F95D013
MKLSVVATLYFSSSFLSDFCRRISAAAQDVVGDAYEIILVNDGSPDDSLQRALELQRMDKHIEIVDLSRNFGHHAAIIAGLSHARGERVFLIDSDLEEQPEWLSLFYQTMEEKNVDVVFGKQQERIASPLSNLYGRTFWSTLNLMSSVRIPHSPMTCRLMTRRYVEALLTVGDRVLFLAGTFAWAGYSQTAIPLTKTPRVGAQKSNYNVRRKIMQVADSISSFSVAPLTLIFFSGLTIWVGSLLYGLFLLVAKLLHPEMVVSGFTSVMLSLWFLGGTVILFLGVLGLYVGKVFQEVKRRPLYIVRQTYSGVRHERQS